MDNSAIVKFLKFLGVKLTPEDVSAVNGEGNTPPADAPKEKPPVMDAPKMNKFDTAVAMLRANAFPAPGGGDAPVAGDAAGAPPVAEPAQASNLPLLDKLITDLGGFEAFKAILLKVVEATSEPAESPAPAIPAPMQNRALLVGKILTNAKGAMSGADLQGMDEGMLKKVLDLLPAAEPAPVNYGALAVKTHSAEPALKRPSFFFAEAVK